MWWNHGCSHEGTYQPSKTTVYLVGSWMFWCTHMSHMCSSFVVSLSAAMIICCCWIVMRVNMLSSRPAWIEADFERKMFTFSPYFFLLGTQHHMWCLCHVKLNFQRKARPWFGCASTEKMNYDSQLWKLCLLDWTFGVVMMQDGNRMINQPGNHMQPQPCATTVVLLWQILGSSSLLRTSAGISYYEVVSAIIISRYSPS